MNSNLRSEFETNVSKIKQHLDKMEVRVNSDSKIVVLEQSHIEHKPLLDQALKSGQILILELHDGNSIYSTTTLEMLL